MALHNELGKKGEELAAAYLRQKGWYIRDRNWRFRHLELDIVATDEWGTRLLFVEVKTRKTHALTDAAAAVDDEKIRNLRKAADAYVKQTGSNAELRFDIITVDADDNGHMTVNHIPNAF